MLRKFKIYYHFSSRTAIIVYRNHTILSWFIMTYFQRFFCLILTLSFSQVVLGQLTDAHEKEFMNKMIQFRHSNPDSLLFYANKISNSKNICTSYTAKYNISTYHYLQGNYSRSESDCLEILSELTPQKLSENSCLVRTKNSAFNRMFWIKYNQNNYEEAFNYLVQRQNLIDEFCDPISKPNQYYTNSHSVSSNMAVVKYTLGLYEEAIETIDAADKTLENLEYNPESAEFSFDNKKYHNYHLMWSRSGNYNIKGDCYLELNQIDSALTYYKKAHQLALKFHPNSKNSETLYNLRVANVYVKVGEFEKAMQLINQYDNNSEENNSTQNINFLKLYTHDKLNHQDSALFYGKQFLLYKKREPSTEKNLIVVYNILSSLYKEQNQTDSAYKYSELATMKLNALRQNTSRMNKSHYLYDFNKVEELNQEILKDKDQESKRNYLVLVLTSVLVISLVSFYGIRRRKKLKVLISQNESRVKPVKTEYNIDAELEEKILNALNDLVHTKKFLDADFTLQAFSKELESNSSYVSSILNNKKQQTFKNYLSELRIQYIIEKLKADKIYRNYTIKALAAEVGYTNASAFTRAFKKQMGITPSQFLAELND